MRVHVKQGKTAIAVAAMAVVSAAIAATALSFSTPVNVSQTPTPTEKAKDVRLAYKDGTNFKKAWVYTYGDGPVGSENVYVKYSFDEGATWSAAVLLSRDAAGAATGGQIITTKGGFSIAADNNKPNIFAPPATGGANVVVTWTSAYCPQDPTASNSGAYTSTVQGQSSLTGGAIDHPYFCLWTATTTDPNLASWSTTQLTNGARDALGDVVTGNATATGYALTWQEDPAGLKPGEAEGPGDGGSGATVTPGTNIWYSWAATPSGATFRTNIRQASDNNDQVTSGAPGASRPNLAMSGNTAVLAYEENGCPGGSTGKCIRYHSFTYNAPTFSTVPGAEGEAGTIVSDVTKNARRVRFVLQGASAAPSSNLRTLLLWRESAASDGEGAPADIVIRRGLANAAAAGTSGFTAADILASSPQNLTNLAVTGANANAHRALIRNGFIALAYDMTPSMNGANAKISNPTTANYNLFLTRSTDSGVTWESARNLTNLTDITMRVVEPRIVATPGTIVNPLTGTADAGDTQNTNTFYLAYATEKNDATAAAGRVYVSRTTDQGATFETFVPVSSVAAGQSEAQLRATPDGSSVAALWMQEQTIGNELTKDAMFASAVPVTVADPVVPPPTTAPPAAEAPTPLEGYYSGGGGCVAAPNGAPFDPVLPLLAAAGLAGLGVRRRRKS